MAQAQAIQDSLAQLRPASGMRASPTTMNEIIKEVLNEGLSGQTYQVKHSSYELDLVSPRVTKSSSRQKI